MKNTITISLILFLLFLSCKENSQQITEYVASNEINKSDEHPGKKLMETHCYVCHSPTASHDNRLAPPMIAVKKHYIYLGTTKEEFTNSILLWIENPKVEEAKMFGAVRRFGVMPKQPFSKEVITQITDYMYDYDIEEPEWFEDHFKEMKKDKQ